MPQCSKLRYLGMQEMNGSDDGIEFAGYALEKVFTDIQSPVGKMKLFWCLLCLKSEY